MRLNSLYNKTQALSQTNFKKPCNFKDEGIQNAQAILLTEVLEDWIAPYHIKKTWDLILVEIQARKFW